MQIETFDFVAGAREARGIAVIIDVFRAFSVEAYAFARGLATSIPVGEIEVARALKEKFPNAILIGERHAKPLPGFDCGNSPTELERIEVHDRMLIHTTHSGTQGLVNAINADEVITGALVNCAAIVRYIVARKPEHVSLVRMGKEATERCDEDDLCAALIAARLRGESPPVDDIKHKLSNAESAQKFFDPACDWAPETDFDLCTAVDQFDFVLKLDRRFEPGVLRRINT